MIIRKAYKFRLKTNEAQRALFWQYAGHCRFVWNYFWRLNQERLKNKQWIMGYGEMDFWVKVLKQSEEYGFLKEAPSHVLQQKLRDLDKAYRDGFNKNQPGKRLPTMRKRAIHSSFRFPEPKQIQFNNRCVKLPKIGWVGFFKSQTIDGEIKNVTISQQAGHWYMSVQVVQEVKEVVPKNQTMVGLDLGVARFVTLATEKEATQYAPRNAYRTLGEKLQKEQKRLSRKEKFTENWKKQRQKVQKVHRKITNSRYDFLHKLSTEISKNHAIIVMEDLKTKNMSKSAKGTMDEPGRNIKAKSGLNKSILDQGWHMFKQQLTYKSQWQGGRLILVDPKHTSQKCATCGHIDSDNRKTQDFFQCTNCDTEENADINAARNILAAGHAVTVCEANRTGGRQQKPVERRELSLPC